MKGYSAEEISRHETPAQFWSNLLSLNVDRKYLGQRLRNISKDDLVAYYKVCSMVISIGYDAQAH